MSGCGFRLWWGPVGCSLRLAPEATRVPPGAQPAAASVDAGFYFRRLPSRQNPGRASPARRREHPTSEEERALRFGPGPQPPPRPTVNNPLRAPSRSSLRRSSRARCEKSPRPRPIGPREDHQSIPCRPKQIFTAPRLEPLHLLDQRTGGHSRSQIGCQLRNHSTPPAVDQLGFRAGRRPMQNIPAAGSARIDQDRRNLRMQNFAASHRRSSSAARCEILHCR